jgi:heptosyltransferase II
MTKLNDIHKILVIRNDGIGDLLNATPAIALLRQNYPHAELTVLARPLNAPVLLGNPDVDCTLIFDPDGAHRRWQDRLGFYHDLRREKYELAIAMRTSSWSNFVAFLSGARYRLGRFNKRFRGTLTHTWQGSYQKGAVHEAYRNLDLVRRICEGEGNRRLVLNLLDDEIADAQKQLAAWGISPDDFLVGIHPGGSSFDKRWPESNYAEIADRVVQKYGTKILILRGPEEATLERNIQKSMKSPSIAHAPKSIRELAALLKGCQLVVCNDSGPMHIAAALDVPMVSLFGPTDHVVWKPLSEKASVVRRDMPCWPCSAHKCKIGWECIKKLPVDVVWDKVESELNRHFLKI